HLTPTQRFTGEPEGNVGRAPDGSWLIDLSGNLPPDGILMPGQISTGCTLTIRNVNGHPVAFSPFVTGVPGENHAPVFVSDPVVEAAAGQPYEYQALGFDSDGDPLTYVLLQRPAGMTMDSTNGTIFWTPTVDSPAQATVVVQVYDSAGSSATQSFLIAV